MAKRCDGRDTYNELQRAVIELTAEIGLENVTMKRIAEKLQISEAAAYRHYSGREDLLRSAFLTVDSRISQFLIGNSYVANQEAETFGEAAYHLWYRIFHYLLENPDETLFIIRFRYSSLYNDELRAQRMSYNGSFDSAFEIVKAKYGSDAEFYQGFIINYVFEIMLSFAEKIITKRIADNAETEKRIWSAVVAVVNAFTSNHSALSTADAVGTVTAGV